MDGDNSELPHCQCYDGQNTTGSVSTYLQLSSTQTAYGKRYLPHITTAPVIHSQH